MCCSFRVTLLNVGRQWFREFNRLGMHQIKSVLIVLVSTVTVGSGFAQTWTVIDVPDEMGSIACSADGSKLVCGDSGSVSISTNSGINWVLTTSPYPLFYVASSADGTKLVAIGSVLCTSGDSGNTWTVQSNAPNANYLYAIASSADGTKLAASGFNGFIYTSTDSGVSWVTNNVPQHNWHSIASSADGCKLVAVVGYNDTGPIYVSTNSGLNWSPTESPTNSWYSVASSADGERLIAAAYLGGVYTSVDGGTSWFSNSLPSAEWVTVASSADGSALVAATDRGMLYASTNAGTVWVPTNSSYPFFCAAASADGKKLFTTGTTGTQNELYVLQSTPSPQLNLTTAGNNLAFSWLVPSENFLLQQNLDLSSTNWLTLTNTPVLNLTNLEENVVLSPTNVNCFYRLVAP